LPLTILLTIIHNSSSFNVPEIDATLSTTGKLSLCTVSLPVSKLLTVKNPVASCELSLTVTIAAAGLETVKSSWLLIAVKILSAVVLLLVWVLNSSVPAVPVVDVKVTSSPLDFVNVNFVPVAILE